MNRLNKFRDSKLSNLLNRLLSLQTTISVAFIFIFTHPASFAFPLVQINNLNQEKTLNSPKNSTLRRSLKNVTSLSDQSAIEEVVIVDNAIQNPESLVDNLSVATKVHYLNSNQDGIEQISRILSSYHNLQAIHILAHGQAGQLNLGSGVLNNLTLRSQTQKLQIWGHALAVDGDILIYGCNFAQGKIGQAVVNGLAQLTGADIAASLDATGSNSLGGDWNLEVQIGKITSTSTQGYFAQSNYNYLLIPRVANPDVSADLCNNQVNLLLIVDESGSIDATEELLQEDAIRASLQYLIDNNVNAQVSIVAFSRIARSLTDGDYIPVNETEISPGGNLDLAIEDFASINPTLRNRTRWDRGLITALDTANNTGIYPEVLIFFTDGLRQGNNPDGDADTFKANGTHIYTTSIGQQGAFQANWLNQLYNLTDGDPDSPPVSLPGSEIYPDNSNALTADHVNVGNYSNLSDDLLGLFQAACAPSASLTKEFNANTIFPTEVSTLTFTITNIDGNPIKSNINFTDEFPENVTIADDSSSITNTCNGILTDSSGATDGSEIIDIDDTGITLTGGSLALGAENCQISVKVTSLSNLANTYINDNNNISNGNNINVLNLNASLTVNPIPVSSLAGDLVINEVLYRGISGSPFDNNEFIELYNASGSSIDLTGLQIVDGNLFATDHPNADDRGLGSINGSDKSYTFGNAAVPSSGSLILEPDDYAVIWIGSDSNPIHNAPQAGFQAWLNQNSRLNNNGEDIWLYDSDLNLIDYIAYGEDNGINVRPDPWDQWDSTYQPSLFHRNAGQSISLTPNGIDSNTSACWELTAIAETDPDSASGRCTGYLMTIDQDPDNNLTNSVGLNNNGNPSLILVKRITNITPNPNNIDFTTIVNDGINDSEDDDPNWEPDFLQGEININNVQPGDEIEYTIYFLSNGVGEVNNVRICDLVPDNMNFVENPFVPIDESKGIVQPDAGFQVFEGIELFFGEDSEPTNLSNAADDDQGEFYAPNTALPAYCRKYDPDMNELVSVDVSDNISGAVVLELDDPIPPATGAGIPSGSYGFLRFRVKID